MIHPYLEALAEKYREAADPVRASQMKAYMKDNFEFFGISTGDRRSIMSTHIKESGLPEWSEIEPIIRSLWEQDEREYQMTAIDLLNRMKKKLGPENLPMLEYLIVTKSWWDSVDGLAGWLVGELFSRHPELIQPSTRKWMASDNIWMQRSCLLFQLKYKEKTDIPLLFGFIGELSDHKSFWIRKAIGWILREYSKTDPNTVENYVADHPELSGLSKREALKQINRKKS